jgi:hypothetical protein
MEKESSRRGILSSLMALLPPVALLPKQAPMRFTLRLYRHRHHSLSGPVMDRSRARDYKSRTRVSHRCISADHGRKPGAGEYRQQWYACGRRGRRLRNISQPSPPVTAQRAAHPCGKVATNLFLSGKNSRRPAWGQWGSHTERARRGSDFPIQEN